MASSAVAPGARTYQASTLVSASFLPQRASGFFPIQSQSFFVFPVAYQLVESSSPASQRPHATGHAS